MTDAEPPPEDDAGRSLSEREADLAADAELVAAVRAAGRSSRAARMLEHQLASYAFPVLRSWLSDLSIFDRLKDRGLRVPGPREMLTEDDRAELALETAARALVSFREGAIFGGGWNPEGGASLRTFFIGACLHQFANVYRKFQTERRRRTGQMLLDSVEMMEVAATVPSAWMPAEARSVDPEATVVGAEALVSVMASLSSREREIVGLLADGYARSEIATLLGTTARAVEATVYRMRRRHARRAAATEIEDRPSAARAPDRTAALRGELVEWGVKSPADALRVLQAISRARSLYENPERRALYRPVESDDRNQLDIILDGERPGTAPADRKKWVADSARVCRDVFARIEQVVPSFRRPGGRRKGIAEDLRELHRAVVAVTGSERTST